MRLISILLFIATVCFAQLPDRNTDLVWSAGRHTVVTNSGLTSNYYFMRNTRSVNRVRDYINTVVLHINTKPSDTLLFEIWRADGNLFDRVYQENINSKVTQNTVDTITLNNYVAVREGDYIALKVGTNGNIGYYNLSLDSSMIYGSKNINFDGVDDDIKGTLTSVSQYIMTIQLLARAPLGVIIGNSISAGHYGNYSGVESSLINDPSYSLGGQLYLIDNGYVFQNMGTGSTKANYLVDNFTDYVKNLKPKWVITETGINDLTTGTAKGTYIANVKTFFDSCDANSIIPIFLKILPCSNATNEQMTTRDNWMVSIDSLVDLYEGAIFINLDSVIGEFRSGGTAGNLWDLQSEYDFDGTHITKAAYIAIADRVSEILNPYHTYYVSTTGDDDNTGTIGSPFLTWQKGINTAEAGDTVYFRGGTYNSTAQVRIDPDGDQYGVAGNNGRKNRPVCLFNYPGETPILDCKGHCTGFTGFNQGINISKAEHIYFKGLTVRNVFLCDSNKVSGAISLYKTANITFENVVVHDVGQRGYWINPGAWGPLSDTVPAPFRYDTTRFINCDIYNLCDTFVNNPGNAADGIKGHTYENNYFYFNGCRVWNYSDDGIDISGEGFKVLNNCWAVPTYKYDGVDLSDENECNGFKLGAAAVTYMEGDTNRHFVTVTNCIATLGRGIGFYDLDYDPYINENGLYYNNLSYKMGIGFSSNSTERETITLRNNISYANKELSSIDEELVVNISASKGDYPESNNNWDVYVTGYPWFVVTDTVTITDADFTSVDTSSILSQLTAARKSNNSLPDITVLKLATGSDLIGAGTYVGMSANPDMGIDWAYLAGVNTAPVVSNIPNQSIVTGNSFLSINLDNYVTDDNQDSDITWTYTGDTELTISILNRVATITYPEDFIGSETITFIATDTGNLTDNDVAIFTVNIISSTTGLLKDRNGNLLIYTNGNFLKK